MKELELKYGCNPNQTPARIYAEKGELPIEILSGNPGYINLLDAFNSWQLVSELDRATGMAAATSFKHVSPAGAAVGEKLSDDLKKAIFIDDIEGLDDSPIACAYARARGTDIQASFGDWAALSRECDEAAAQILLREVSDGIIAPGYTGKALEMLKTKRKGGYNIIKIDPLYRPNPVERRNVFGITFEQGRNEAEISYSLLDNVVTQNKNIPDSAKRDLIIALITLKYTQSNSVCYALGGQTVGIGAGQQSRIACTRLAGDKADYFFLRLHPKTIGLSFSDSVKRPERNNIVDIYLSDTPEAVIGENEWQKYFTVRPEKLSDEEKIAHLASIRGVSLGSDAFFPFDDNIDRARKSGVQYIAEPGGSLRSDTIIDACDKYGIALAFTGIRLFHH